MTYEEYLNQRSALSNALALLDQQHIADHGLPMGTRVVYNDNLGYVESVSISFETGEVFHQIRAAKKDGTKTYVGKILAYHASVDQLEVA